MEALAKVGSGRYGLGQILVNMKGDYGDLIGLGIRISLYFTELTILRLLWLWEGMSMFTMTLRVPYEIGPIGVILFHGMMFMVVWYGFKLIKVSKKSIHTDIGARHCRILVFLPINY